MKKILVVILVFIQVGYILGGSEYTVTNNQAVGNAIGYQWGVYTPVEYSNKSDTLGYINSQEWIPAYYDTYRGLDDDQAQPVSPLEGNSGYVHSIKKNIKAEAVEDGQGGEIVKMTWETTQKWKRDPNWGVAIPTDKWSFGREMAKKYGMKIYLQGKGQKIDEWYAGPIEIYDLWDVEALKDQIKQTRGRMLNSDLLEGENGCWSKIDESVQRVTIVLTTSDKKVALGIKNITGDVILRLRRTVYGTDMDNYENGVVDLIVRQPAKINPEYSKDDITAHSTSMEIGSMEQLVNQGYWTSEYESDIKSSDSNVPGEFQLYDNYPNPFNPTTTIKFDLPQTSDVKLQVYNIRGRTVKTEEYNNLAAGQHEYKFDGSNLSSGIYFYKIESSQFQEVKKMIYLK